VSWGGAGEENKNPKHPRLEIDLLWARRKKTKTEILESEPAHSYTQADQRKKKKEKMIIPSSIQ